MTLPPPATDGEEESEGEGEASEAAEAAPPTAAQLLGGLEIPPSDSVRLNDHEFADL
jgi:hypothetical protein